MHFRRHKAARVGWEGSFRDLAPRQRTTLLCSLGILCVSLVFSHFGFVPVPLSGTEAFHVFPLLAPMAVAAFALGLAGGALIGLLCGATLYLHAALRPLDVFEAGIVHAAPTIAVFGVTGLLLGLLLPMVSAPGASGWRRLARLASACLLASLVFNSLFYANVAWQPHADVPGAVEGGAALAQGPGHSLLLGQPDIATTLACQVPADAALMAVACWALDVAMARIGFDGDRRSLRLTFNLGLLLTVFLAFMVVTAVATVAETEREKELAHRNIFEECEYLDIQRVEQERRGILYAEALNHGVSYAESASDLPERHFDSESLLQGYSTSADGLVIIAYGKGRDAIVLAADDESVTVGETIEDALDDSVVEAIEASLADGSLQRTVFDRGAGAVDGSVPTPQLVYLAAYSSLDIGNASPLDLSDKSHGYSYVIVIPSEKVFADRGEIVRWISQTAFALMAVVYVLVSQLLGQTVIGPMTRVGEELDSICTGKLDTVVDARGSTEFVSLSAGINTTVEALKGWIAEAERRIERELETSRAIQLSALPSVFPAFPDISEFDLYASMDTAREVGGDFYDFFLVGEDVVAFLVADVSGKGIPASLFMMASKANLGSYLSSGMGVAEAVGATNVRLCDGNEEEMFVTAWVATLDFKRGVMSFVNAGHNQPLLRHEGRWRWIDQRGGLFMGAFAGAEYHSTERRSLPATSCCSTPTASTRRLTRTGGNTGTTASRRSSPRTPTWAPRSSSRR